MQYELDNQTYNVIITKKNNKNLYIRVKDDMNIYVTCNYLTTNKKILSILNDNESSLRKMIEKVQNENKKKEKFFYLGNSYDIIEMSNVDNVCINGSTIICKDKTMLDKWLKKEIIRIFDERYVYVYNHFNENIKSPLLRIRNMKTRWGVYNRVNHTITLNSRLIEFDIEKIDYVIVHELSHILYFNHSKDFWNLVSKYCVDYKRIRKEMNK